MSDFITPLLTLLFLIAILYVVQNPNVMTESFRNQVQIKDEQNQNQNQNKDEEEDNFEMNSLVQERHKAFNKYPFL